MTVAEAAPAFGAVALRPGGPVVMAVAAVAASVAAPGAAPEAVFAGHGLILKKRSHRMCSLLFHVT
jgi:hypothetical protein